MKSEDARKIKNKMKKKKHSKKYKCGMQQSFYDTVHIFKCWCFFINLR